MIGSMNILSVTFSGQHILICGAVEGGEIDHGALVC